MSALSTRLVDLPLFPLRTVLFPGGLLPLKVFEARYVDMARATACSTQILFGVCLLKSGPEVAHDGEVAVPETIGCMTGDRRMRYR